MQAEPDVEYDRKPALCSSQNIWERFPEKLILPRQLAWAPRDPRGVCRKSLGWLRVPSQDLLLLSGENPTQAVDNILFKENCHYLKIYIIFSGKKAVTEVKGNPALWLAGQKHPTHFHCGRNFAIQQTRRFYSTSSCNLWTKQGGRE